MGKLKNFFISFFQNFKLGKFEILLSKIHEDLVGLIWIANGRDKNYFLHYKKNDVIESNNKFVSKLNLRKEEPSLISTKLPIKFLEDTSLVPKPYYYPSYYELTPEQRGVYWEMLKNPYNGEYNIGYIFILYYGLERHLFEGNYEKAFNVILKLRDVYNNKSFQSYSACALIISSIKNKRYDLLRKFCRTINNTKKINFSDNLFLLCHYILNIPLTAYDIMRMAKTFEFKQKKYIKDYPNIFEKNLEQIMIKKWNQSTLDMGKYITIKKWKNLRRQEINIYANYSLEDVKFDVPMIVEDFSFKKIMYDILDLAYKQTRKELLDFRNHSDKLNKNLVLNPNLEKQIKEKIANSENVMEKHKALLKLRNFYYKYRKIDEKYLNKAIEICYMDLELLPKIQDFYASQLQKLKINDEKTDNKFFQGKITSFKKLAIIYEKKYDFNKAIEICNKAIKYYEYIGNITNAIEFKQRKIKLQKL